MNLILFAALVVGFVPCSNAEILEKSLNSKPVKENDLVDKNIEKFYGSCLGRDTKFNDALNFFLQCMIKSSNSLTICQTIQTCTLNCTASLVKVVEDCLPSKSKGLPTLVINSFRSAADFLCKQKGESLFELFNPCLYKFDPTPLNQEWSKCQKKVQTSIDKYRDTSPSPSDICSAAADLRNCFQIILQMPNGCPNEKTKMVVLGLYDACIAPCGAIKEANA